MTTTTRNGAAERLLDAVEIRAGAFFANEMHKHLNEALAAERRATVERIRARLDAKRSQPANMTPVRWGFMELEIRAILDEEADR